MFRYAVSCSLDDVPTTAPAVFRGDIDHLVDAVRRHGFQGFELHLKDPERFDWGAMRRAADRAGLVFTGTAVGREFSENKLCLTDPDPAARRACVDKLKRHIDMAAVLGCMVGIASIRGKISDAPGSADHLALLRDGMGELCDYAAENGVTLLLENLARSANFALNSMRELADFADALGRPNLLLQLDTCSLARDGADIAASVRDCGTRLGYVHFADSDRLAPGAGNIDFAAYVRELIRAGYAGFIAFECVPLPTSDACAEAALAHTRALVAAAER